MKPVRLAVCSTKPAVARGAAAGPPPELATSGVSSLKFGDDTVYYGAAKPIQRVPRPCGRRASRSA